MRPLSWAVIQLACVAALLPPPDALAQNYVAVVFTPAPGHAWTLGSGAADTHFAGFGAFPGENYPEQARAVLFIANAYVDVTPAGASGALINDSASGQHGGGVGYGGYPGHAYLWNEGQAVNLHPMWYTVSEVLGVGGGQQAGYAFRSFHCSECGTIVAKHAGIWSGTAASFELLHTPAHTYTAAWGTDGEQQVGQGIANSPSASHAILWNGPEGAAVDLHPAGAYEMSQARGVSGGEQVGSVVAGYIHAALWRGSAASFVDLNPAGYYQSDARSVRNGVQVGLGSRPAEGYRALAWQGTAASVIDLHALLPPAYQSWNSGAEDVDGNGNIVGFVQLSDQFRPVVWFAAPPSSNQTCSRACPPGRP